MSFRLSVGTLVVGMLGLLAFAGVVTAGELDLSGNWIMTMEGDSPSGEENVEVTFEQDGNGLVATMKGKRGEVQCEGWLDGGKIRFYYSRATDSGEHVAKYVGHVHGDLMGGEVEMGEHGKTKWRATRSGDKGIDLSGDWTMTMEGDSPTGVKEVALSFSQSGSSLIATLGTDKGEVECEGHIAGNSLRFYYVRPAGGDEFVAKYSGHVGGDVMGGEVDLGEHGKTSWKATRNKG